MIDYNEIYIRAMEDYVDSIINKKRHAITASFALPSLIERGIGMNLQNRMLFKSIYRLLDKQELKRPLDDEEDKYIKIFLNNKTMHIQLKYSENKQDASFMKSVLKNFLEAYLLDKNRAFKLVYDFSVAKGHLSKLVNNILDSDELQYWKATVDEIKNENPQWNWNQLDFDDLISKVSYENIKKAVLAERVEIALIENYDITTDNIKLFANSIKMFCFEKMETRSAVSLNDLKHQIELVKFDISKGAENPAHGWIEKVNFNELTDQESSYYEGKKATPMDIVKGLPVSRVLLEKDIRTSVNNYMVTVIKSSSGQGKTTLALKTQYGLQKEYTPYRMPDDAHKEMPRRNLVIAFHKEFTSLWIKTIQSNYEFDSVSEWIEYWFQVRKCMYECLDKIGVYMYKALAGKRTGSTGTEFDKTRKKMDRMLCSTLSYPKEHRPFEEEVEVPKKFLEVKQAYFNSMQNFLRQVAGLIQRDENDVRLALYNLKQAKAGLPKMHKFFDGMELDEEMASKHTNLCRQESQKILEIYMCCQYFLQHDASPLFDKYQIRNWYRDVCTKEIEDVNVALDAMQQEYDAVFPDQAYEEAVFKHYPIILRSFDMTSEEVMQDFVLRTIAFAETSFDYMLVLQCDENGAILQHAIKFPKRFFKAIQEALVSGEEITDTSLLTTYPIDVTENMLECFSGDWKIKRQTDNPYVHYLGDIAEELWVYSKLRELLCTEEDREYCRCELKKVAEKIAIMKKEIHLHLDEEIANQIDVMCNHVYEGNCFDNIRLNEFVQNLQYILV